MKTAALLRRAVPPRASSRTLSTGEVLALNSLRGVKEPLPAPRGSRSHLTWYACGPTVYDDAHLGHARTYVCFDIVRRVISEYLGRPVLFAVGVTDIDDKIVARSAEQQRRPLDLAKEFEVRFFEDMAALGVLPPHAKLRVSDHIHHIVDYIKHIENKGLAYTTASGVYFDVQAFSTQLPNSYGKFAPAFALQPLAVEQALAEIDLDGQSQLAEGEVAGTAGDKRDQRDFALWKAAKVGESEASGGAWDSPWGPGRPGWHIECSALTHSLFGRHLDIHSGGRDLAFPHHCNEIAQCEAHHGKADDWVSLWMHTGHMFIKGRKMSKSLKNFISVRDFLRSEFDPDDLRVFCLQYHYSADVHYSDERMREARVIRTQLLRYSQRARECVEAACTFENEQPTGCLWGQREHELFACLSSTQHTVHDALTNDFDTPKALRALVGLASAGEGYLLNSAKLVARGECGAVPAEPTRSVVTYMDGLLSSLGLSSFAAQTTNDQQLGDAEMPCALHDGHALAALKVLAAHRTSIRSACKEALSVAESSDGHCKALAGQLLALCDELRDRTLPEQLGVCLEDRPDGNSMLSPYDPTLQRRPEDHSQGPLGADAAAATGKSRRAGKSTAELQVPPEQLFQQGPHAGRFSRFDDDGLPTHDAGGEALSKSARKKLSKARDKHARQREKAGLP